MAKQDGQKSGVSGIPILTIPEFTRLIREMFPTSQLINDAQGRQVYSGIKMRPASKSIEAKVIIKQNGIANGANGDHFKTANGRSGNFSFTVRILTNLEANGVSNDEEDSNHSQQSLDSVGGSKPAHLAVKTEPKAEEPKSDQPVKEKPLENGINGANGKHDEVADLKLEKDEVSV